MIINDLNNNKQNISGNSMLFILILFCFLEGAMNNLYSETSINKKYNILIGINYPAFRKAAGDSKFGTHIGILKNTFV